MSGNSTSGGNNPPFRPLAARQPKVPVGGGPDDNPAGSAPNPPAGPAPFKKAYATAACASCRKRRTKCSAERPRCSQCRARDLDCRYDADVAETPGQARKRKLSELQTRSVAYEELYNALQSRPLEEAIDILRRIRDGFDAETLLRQLQAGDLLLQLVLVPELRYQFDLPYAADLSPLFNYPNNQYVPSLLFRSTFDRLQLAAPPPGSDVLEVGPSFQPGPSSTGQERTAVSPNDDKLKEFEKVYTIPFRGAEIVDPRIDAVDVSKWTTVYSDRTFLRKLMATYFLYEYPFFTVFQKEFMLDDMIAGRHRFCSPLLVNAILATACHGLASIKNRSEFWNLNNPGYVFLTEARRLWELEAAENPKVTTVQAACIMSVAYTVNGVDRVGNSYLVQAIAMAEKLQLFSRSSASTGRKMRITRTILAWGLFGQQGLFRFNFLRPPYITTPPEDPLPDRDNAVEFFSETWVKYPLAQQPVPLLQGLTFLTKVELRSLMTTMAQEICGNDGQAGLSVQQAVKFRSALMSWYDRLPEPLSANKVILPTHLIMHMQYHYILIILFEPLVGRDMDNYPPSVPPPVDIVEHAHTSLETLLHLFYRRHGFECYHFILVQILSQLGFRSVQRVTRADLDTPAREAVRATLLLAAMGLHEQGRNFYLAEAVLRVLHEAMSADDTRLLQERAAFDNQNERKIMVARQVHGDWPVFIDGITQDPAVVGLDRLVKGYADMSLDESSGSGSGGTPPS